MWWKFASWMCSRQICSNCVMLSCQYGPKSLRNVSNTLLNLCHEELKQFWRKKWVQPGSSSLRSYTNSCHYRKRFCQFHNPTIILSAIMNTILRSLSEEYGCVLNAASSESRWWTFSTNHRTGFTDKMCMTVAINRTRLIVQPWLYTSTD